MMLKLKHLDRALRYEKRMNELEAKLKVGAGRSGSELSDQLAGWCRSDRSDMNHEYKLMEPPPAEPLEACPCCGNGARVWEYVEVSGGTVVRVVMCDHEGSIGPRDALVYDGCLLQMPPDDFYRGTGRDAVRYWNEYAKALTAAQRANRWKTAQVLREPQAG